METESERDIGLEAGRTSPGGALEMPTVDPPPAAPILPPDVPITPIDQKSYEPHAEHHEITGDDTIRLSLLSNGAKLNRYRSINVLSPLTVTEDKANKRFNLGFTAVAASGARAYITIAQSLASAAYNTIYYNATRFDTNSYWNGATRLTVPTAGIYIFTAVGEYASNINGARHLQIRHGPSGLMIAQVHVYANQGGNTIMNASGIWQCAAGDYAETLIMQNSGGNLNLLTAEFAVARIG